MSYSKNPNSFQIWSSPAIGKKKRTKKKDYFQQHYNTAAHKFMILEKRITKHYQKLKQAQENESSYLQTHHHFQTTQVEDRKHMLTLKLNQTKKKQKIIRNQQIQYIIISSYHWQDNQMESTTKSYATNKTSLMYEFFHLQLLEQLLTHIWSST